MILLDTLSELMRAAPERGVERWMTGQPGASLFVSVISEAEQRHGVALLPPGKRRSLLAAAIDGMLGVEFTGRILSHGILSHDSAAAVAFAEIAASRRHAGRPIAQADVQIAAIARSRSAALATRNGPDFAGCGIEVVNPWTKVGSD